MASSPPSLTSSVSPDPSASPDELEKHLQPEAQDGTRIADFLHDYLLFKHETFESFDSMVWLSVVKHTKRASSIQSRLKPTKRASSIRSRLFRPKTRTFTEFLRFLREELRATGKAGVSFW